MQQEPWADLRNFQDSRSMMPKILPSISPRHVSLKVLSKFSSITLFLSWISVTRIQFTRGSCTNRKQEPCYQNIYRGINWVVYDIYYNSEIIHNQIFQINTWALKVPLWRNTNGLKEPILINNVSHWYKIILMLGRMRWKTQCTVETVCI